IHKVPPQSDGEVTGVAPEDWQRVVHGMIGVTTRGTAAAIGYRAPYTFGGKTGTAQVFTVGQNEKYNASKISERLRDHSWFIAFALVVLYSASGQSVATVVRTALRLRLGTVALVLLARVNPNFLRRATPWLYVAGCVLLLIVAAIGHVGMGAQRWLNLGLFRFQPSELMKLAVPMTCAWYLHDRPLPPSWRSLAMLTVLILMPVGLVAIQPD